jgi:D-aspartate ligase
MGGGGAASRRARRRRTTHYTAFRGRPGPAFLESAAMPAGPLPPAVVCEAGWVNGLAAVRSLGRIGAPVVVVDHRPGALGFRSRYAEGYVAPDPTVDADGFVQALAALGDRLAAPAPIFPTHDEHLAAIARARPALGDRFRYPLPAWSLVERLGSKRFQLETAAAAGVAVPATVHPESEAEAAAAGDAVGFPAIVKPSAPFGFRRRFGRQAFLCADRGELVRAYGLAAGFAPMVQEFVPGGDDELYTLGSYLDAGGSPLGLFSGRKLRQTGQGMGTARVAEAVWVDEVVDAGLALLAALRFTGISQVEFKRDPRSGAYKLMEVNARLWQWHGLAAACGVDLPAIAYRDAIGRPPAPARMRREGRRWAITLMGGASPALQRPPYTDAVVALDDPLPVLAHGARMARSAVRRLIGGRRSGRA